MKRFRSREERECVPLIAHSHKQQVESRKLASPQAEMRGDGLLIFAGGLPGVRIFTLDALDLVRFQRNFRKHRFGGHAKIAVRVARADVALIAEKHLYFIPRNLGTQRVASQQTVENFRSGPSSQRDMKSAPFAHGSSRGLHKLLRGM